MLSTQDSSADCVVTKLLEQFWEEAKRFIETQMSKSIDEFNLAQMFNGREVHPLVNAVSAIGRIGYAGFNYDCLSLHLSFIFILICLGNHF